MDVRRSEEETGRSTMERERAINFNDFFTETPRPAEQFDDRGFPLPEAELSRQKQVDSHTRTILGPIRNWLQTKTVVDSMLIDVANDREPSLVEAGKRVSENALESLKTYTASCIDMHKTIDVMEYDQRTYGEGIRRRQALEQIENYKINLEAQTDVVNRLNSFLIAVGSNGDAYDLWIKGMMEKAEPFVSDQYIETMAQRGIAEIDRRRERALEDTQPLDRLNEEEVPTPTKTLGIEAAKRIFSRP